MSPWTSVVTLAGRWRKAFSQDAAGFGATARAAK